MKGYSLAWSLHLSPIAYFVVSIYLMGCNGFTRLSPEMDRLR